MQHLEGLNPAQKEAVTTTEGPVLIVAGAGSGKTRVITHRIAHIVSQGIEPANILAVTFTNKAAKEMRERAMKLLSNDFATGSTPFISTFHALGVFLLRSHYKELDIPKHFTIFDRDDSKKAVKQALKKKGLDPKEYDPGKILNSISKQKGDSITVEEFTANASSYYEELIADIWNEYERILQKNRTFDFDDLLLKSVSFLRKHKDIREKYHGIWKYVHVDEYQDTNQVQYDLIKLLTNTDNNICVVGDGDQCLIKGTKVTLAEGKTINIEKIKKDDLVMSNYGSGDFRPARVTSVLKKKTNSTLVRIHTSKGRTIESTPEHIHFAGYRLGDTPQSYVTYLMYKKSIGWRLGVSQIYTNGGKNTIAGFAQRSNQEHADALWIVGTYTTPNEARVHEYTLSLQYKIPTLPFVARKGGSTNGYVHDQKIINKIFSSFNTDQGAKKLLKSLGLLEKYPHHRPQSHNSNRRNIIITLCGDRRGSTPMHRMSMVGNDVLGKKILTSIGLSVRPAKKGSKSWRVESSYGNYEDVLGIAERINKAFPEASIIQNARLEKNKKDARNKNSLSFMPAGSIVPGMVLFNDKGGYDIVKKVEVTKKSPQTVYDLNIEKTHNYIANGIVTHNCIYSWRGASIRNILTFGEDFSDTKTILLEENYRSTKNILGAANEIIKKNNNRVDKKLFTQNDVGEKIECIEGWSEGNEAEKVAQKIKELLANGTNPNEIVMLYRANFQSRVLEESLLRAGISYQLLGTKFFDRKEVKDTLSFIRAALNPDNLVDIARIINTPVRGIGKVTIAKVINGEEETLTGRARESVQKFRTILQKIHSESTNMLPSELVRFTFKVSGLEESFKSQGEDGIERFENVQELVSLATRYDTYPEEDRIGEFLSDVALASDQDELMKDGGEAVKMMTVHASKGLEFDTVFITGLEEGLFPHEGMGDAKTDDEEERRLFYVAVTRARKKIFLSYANSRTIYGTTTLRAPSQFIADIGNEFLEATAPVELADIDTQRKKGISSIFDIDF